MTLLLATPLLLVSFGLCCLGLYGLACALRDVAADELEAMGRDFDHGGYAVLHETGRCGCHGQSDVAVGPVSTCVALGRNCAHKGET